MHKLQITFVHYILVQHMSTLHTLKKKQKNMENQERVERELLEQCNQVATLTDCFSWLQQCDEYIKPLEELFRAKRPRLTIGYRQSAVARIARLAGAKLELERRFVHISGEYASGEYASGNERSLVWREIDAAFESRILTGDKL